MGGFSILTYVVNWNNRGYQRYKLAYEQLIDPESVDEFLGSVPAADLLQYRNSFRRARDLSIILLGLFYIIQAVDAHATAHMKAYDVSDDLSRIRFDIEPSAERLYTHGAGGGFNAYGLSFSMRF
jgi:hypothetical protein